MTTVAPPQDLVDTAVLAEPDDEGDSPTSGGPRLPAGWCRRRSPRSIAVLVLVVGLVAVFEVGVTGVWYHTRQRQLATDFKVGRTQLAPGDVAAVLQIPRLDVNVYVVEGDAVAQLRSGPGHRPGTPLPGKVGNSVIVGHRKGWGHPFARPRSAAGGQEPPSSCASGAPSRPSSR